MRIRTLTLFLLLVLTGLFAAANWGAFVAPSTLSLGVTTIEAPLGVIMLCLFGFVCVLFIAWVIYLQGTVLMETRRQARELAAQRELADRAEASRLTELRSFLSAELDRVGQASSDLRDSVLQRLDELERRSRTSLEQTGNSLSAYIGELEDRLNRPRLPPDVPRSDTGQPL